MRQSDDEALIERIKVIHARSDETYGVPRIRPDLADEGWHIGGKRVARLMRQIGVKGVTRRKGTFTTERDRQRRAWPDRVERVFEADAPDQLYVADITYIPTWQGFLYLAIALDVFSRRIVGWSMAPDLRSQLVLDALEMALWQRKPEAVIHHSDQGCQYTSVAFGERCRQANVRPSMGSVGDCYDNAMAESFFATLECELLDRCTLRSHSEARSALFSFIEGWYNPHRRHSGNNQVSPVNFEIEHARNQSLEVSTEPG
jgi:putative transposase